MDDRLLASMLASIERTDGLHAQYIAELEKTIAGLHEVLRDLAGAGMGLMEINAPRDPTDTVIIKDHPAGKQGAGLSQAAGPLSAATSC
jgi:hypothetical protein